MSKKAGFTLIELLVVIAIIALLLSILTPALRRVKAMGIRLVCSNNIKQNSMALLIYGTTNNDYLPLQTLGDFLHDVSYATSDMIIKLGGTTKGTFYCPSTKKWDRGGDKALYWQWSQAYPLGPPPKNNYGPEPDTEREEEYRVTGYFWMLTYYNEDLAIDTDGAYGLGRGWEPEGKHTWLYKTTHYSNGKGELGPPVRNPSAVPFVTDQIFTDDDDTDYRECDFSGTMLGGMGDIFLIPDVSNHLEGTKVRGGNIGFLDGHVEWRKIEDMQQRNYRSYFPSHWW
jgi:prepilin-type N-terminal cleavage/methylation domain-containing protein/prepilin-type processing-associated H-X9-DG protein